MAIAHPLASDLIERAKQARLSIHFRLDDDHDHCLIDVEWQGTNVALTQQWFTTDCVGPKHGQLEEHELGPSDAVDWLAETIQAPYEVNQHPADALEPSSETGEP